MWRNAKISPLGMYEWDNTVFDFFKVPTTHGGMDRQVVIDAILNETSDLSLSTFTSPESFKYGVQLWTNKNLSVWEELWETMNYDYNPIWNYDREEHGKDKDHRNHVETPNVTVKDNFERNLNDSTLSDSNHNVAAFNNGIAPESTDHADVKTDATGTTKNTNKRTGTITNKEHDVHTHDFHAYGNIGVTTTQDMIKQQREIVQFNLIDYIVHDFKRHFCTMVY